VRRDAKIYTSTSAIEKTDGRTRRIKGAGLNSIDASRGRRNYSPTTCEASFCHRRSLLYRLHVLPPTPAPRVPARLHDICPLHPPGHLIIVIINSGEGRPVTASPCRLSTADSTPSVASSLEGSQPYFAAIIYASSATSCRKKVKIGRVLFEQIGPEGLVQTGSSFCTQGHPRSLRMCHSTEDKISYIFFSRDHMPISPRFGVTA